MGSVTLAQLRAFLTAVRKGSFTAASAELGMSSASVSELVRRLEEHYGLLLFSRGTRRLTMTSAGEMLLPIAERAVSTMAYADAALQAFGGLTGGIATFGLFRNAEYYLLADLAHEFHQRFPRVRVRLIGQHSVDVVAAVAAGDVEAGIAVDTAETAGLDVRPLLRDEIVLVTTDPARYPGFVTPATLAVAPLVLYDAHYGVRDPTRRQITAWAAAAGHTLDPIIEVEHVTSALRLVERGVADTFVSRAVTRAPGFPQGLSLVLFDPPIHDVIVSLTRDASILSPASRELLLLAEHILQTRNST